jgi:hypothetical protein
MMLNHRMAQVMQMRLALYVAFAITLMARGRLFDARDEVLSWFGANDPVAD